MNTTSTRAGAALVVGLLLLAATGCATDSTPRSIAPKTSVLTLTSIVPRSVAPRGVEASTAASSAPPAQAGLPYVVRPTRLRGGDSRSITYDITIPQVSGGSPAVAGEFNESMRAAVEGITDPTRADRGDAQNQPGDFTVHIGRRVISSQLLVYFVPIPVPAHGGTLISTVTVDADTARPITVSDLFPDLRAGLTRLSGVAAELVPRTRAGVGYERRGIEPREENFANWTASPQGMQIHFLDYQLGGYALGRIDITIPWVRLADVLAPGMLEVVSS